MDFELSDEPAARRDSVRRLAQDKVRPRARAIDKEGVHPQDVFDAFGSAGLLGPRVPSEYGGSGAGILGLGGVLDRDPWWD